MSGSTVGLPADDGSDARTRSRTHSSRQATVAAFDPDTGAGAVLHDDGGWRQEFSAEAFRAGGLRLLRVGQRVRLDYARAEGTVPGEGDEVSRVTLITLP